MQEGREIFLKQLELMQEDGFEVETDCLSKYDQLICTELADVMKIPEKLKYAFNAYCLEYIIESDDVCANGVFFNDEDMNEGIYDKLYYFYCPIFNYVEKEYDIQIMRFIEPSCRDCSNVVGVVLSHRKNRLDITFVAHMDRFKVWWSFFNTEKLPEDIYKEIEKILKMTRSKVEKGLKMYAQESCC